MPHCNWLIEAVDVQRVGGGIPDKSWDNALKQYHAAAENMIVSGWLVQPFDHSLKGFLIIHHWWNIFANQTHFDTTPLVKNGDEYVADLEITTYLFENSFAGREGWCLSAFVSEQEIAVIDQNGTGEIEYRLIEHFANSNFIRQGNLHPSLSDDRQSLSALASLP